MTKTDWIDRESARIAGAKQQAETRDQEALEAAMTAQQGSPEYWSEFVKAVKLQTDKLEKAFTRSSDEKIVGNCIVEEPNSTRPNHSCTIIVTRYSVKLPPGPGECKMHFYYAPGSAQIKRSAWGQPDVFTDLRTSPRGVVADVSGSSMTASEFAAYLVKGMYERVKFPE
ncbi:MAG TPA: hypothetical protein VHU89_00885 [Acidobacteriaceae bacterium]|jgi:hypothetical protein|nr:hypothetical protein [Acidobacteriaceae bacterium]